MYGPYKFDIRLATRKIHSSAHGRRNVPKPFETAMDSNATWIAEIIKKLLVVPDKLVTAQLCLRPLSHCGPDASTESIHAIGDACDLMHSALADVVEVARNLAEVSGIDQGGPAFERVGLDSYYHQVP